MPDSDTLLLVIAVAQYFRKYARLLAQMWTKSVREVCTQNGGVGAAVKWLRSHWPQYWRTLSDELCVPFVS